MGNKKSVNPQNLTEKEIRLIEFKTKLSKEDIVQWHKTVLVDTF